MFKILHIPTGCFLYIQWKYLCIGHPYIIDEYPYSERSIFTVNNKDEFLQLIKSSRFTSDIQLDLRFLKYPTTNIDIADFELCEAD